jgi:hypothetical protein
MMATSTGVRARRLHDLVSEELRTLELLRGRVGRRRAAIEDLAKHLAADEELLERRLNKFEVRLKKLDEWRKEPVVIVRTSAGGYGLPVYHDAKDPCGFGRNLLDQETMLLAEAEEAGHRPCTACGYQARRRRTSVAV